MAIDDIVVDFTAAAAAAAAAAVVVIFLVAALVVRVKFLSWLIRSGSSSYNALHRAIHQLY